MTPTLMGGHPLLCCAIRFTNSLHIFTDLALFGFIDMCAVAPVFLPLPPLFF